MSKNSKREENSDSLPSKPPVILQNIKWLLTYGSKNKKIIAIGVLFLILAWIVQHYDVISLFTNSNEKTPIGVKHLNGLSILLYHKVDHLNDAENMEEKLNRVGAKVTISQQSVPSNRTQGVVYYLRASNKDAAQELINLFPKKGLRGPELLEFHQSAYPGTDVFLYLP
jgi:hypothetical protein